MFKIISLTIIFLLFFCNTFATIYRYTDSQGTAVYSDQPNARSEKVALPRLNISTAPSDNNSDNKNTTETKLSNEVNVYSEFDLVFPGTEIVNNEATFWNPESISVSIKIKPDLRAEDAVQYYFDNEAITPLVSDTTATKALTFSIPKMLQNKDGSQKQLLTRGTHTISAAALDKTGATIQTTKTITVYIHFGSTQR